MNDLIEIEMHKNSLMLQKQWDVFNKRLLFVYEKLNGQIASSMHSDMMF